MKKREKLLKNCRRIVIKLGTNVLCSGAEGDILNEKRIKHIARQINDLRERGKEIIVVSSGAIGVGMHKMGFDMRPHDIPKLQALAAIGQNKLLSVYQKAFKRYGMIIAQLLLTQGDVTDRKRYINVRHTFQELLAPGSQYCSDSK
jgi:glutamate 5-kinase